MTYLRITTDDQQGIAKAYVGEGDFISEPLQTKGGLANCHVPGQMCIRDRGYGSPVMENRADWHHKVPNDEEYTRIREDLLSKMEER